MPGAANRRPERPSVPAVLIVGVVFGVLSVAGIVLRVEGHAGGLPLIFASVVVLVLFFAWTRRTRHLR